jgi:hypothetical protein
MVALVAMSLVLSVLLVPAPSNAADAYWIGDSGFWSEGINWNPAGPPLVGNDVYLNSSDATDRTVYYDSNSEGDFHYLRVDSTGTGTMILSIPQGNLRVFDGSFPSINSPSLEIGYNGTGIVNQTGGRVEAPNVSLGGNPGGSGIYNLSGGTLYAYDLINIGASSTFNHTGGNIPHASYGMDIAGTYNINNDASAVPDMLFIRSTGILNQSGGFISTVSGVSGNEGMFNMSGGIYNVYKDFYNSGTVNYSGGQITRSGEGEITNNGTINLSGAGTRTIDVDVVNNGTFKATNTTASYTGSFTNNGAYISDPSAQHFNDLIIGQNGYLKGGLADFFFVSGDFKNQSTMNTAWNTSFAYLGFEDGVNPLHGFYLAGQDYGAVPTGYKDNFSWGFLDLTEDTLQLYDGNNIAGGALYAGDLWGLQVKDSLIKNIIGMDGLNIYYLANQLGNVYLQGLTYNLTGGGRLIPVGTASVPEPATMLLLGSGLVGLEGFRRKFKK